MLAFADMREAAKGGSDGPPVAPPLSTFPSQAKTVQGCEAAFLDVSWTLSTRYYDVDLSLIVQHHFTPALATEASAAGYK